MLPHLGHQSLYDEADRAFEEAPAWKSPPNLGVKTVVRDYVCPLDSRLSSPITDDRGYTAAYTSFVGILGDAQGSSSGPRKPGANFGDSAGHGVRFEQITDGTGQTILFGESPPPGLLFGGSWYSDDLPPELAGRNLQWRHGISMFVRKPNTGSCRGPFRFAPGRLRNLCDSHHLWSLHPGGANFAFADGSVRYLSYSADSILGALATRDGGEVVELP